MEEAMEAGQQIDLLKVEEQLTVVEDVQEDEDIVALFLYY